MEFNIKSGTPEKQRVACVIVGIYEPRKLTFAADLLDRNTQGLISHVVRHGDIEGTLGDVLMLHPAPNTLLCERILLVGLGKEKEFNTKAYREALHAATRALIQSPAMEAVNYLTELTIKKCDTEWMIEQAVVAIMNALYRFDRFKSKMDKPTHGPRRLTLAVPRRSNLPAGERGLQRGLAIAQGMNLTKDLCNLPSNICTPTLLADEATKIAQATNTSIQILLPDDIQSIGMNAFLSVAKGSAEKPRFIVLQYHGAPSENQPIVLVGKGITFDSGGISLKPAENMDEMKYDMSGAAAVLGAFYAAAKMQLALNLIALVPTCENMPSANANKPGDIVTALSGTTIEILNTDAEGRLILCDALTYAKQFDPKLVIDVATLTGACTVALGHIAIGLYSNQDSLARDILAAGERVGDRAWHMPLWDEYQEQIKSPFADLANTGGRPGGSITAALFLSHFTKDYNWAHLDIAGVAWKSGKEKGATARPVPLLVEFLQDRAHLAASELVRRGRPPQRSHPEATDHDAD